MIDFNKPVQTRDGRKVRILCTDCKSPLYPVVTLIKCENGSEQIVAHTLEGVWLVGSAPHRNDLVNVPQRHKHADVIIAWANGAEIEFRPNCAESWRDLYGKHENRDISPAFHVNWEYRVKCPDTK